VDVSDPAAPVLRGGVSCSSSPSDLAVSGNHALVSASTSITTIDLSDPDNPVIVSSFSTGIPGNSYPSESPVFENISVSGNQAAVLTKQWGIYYDPWGGPMPVLIDHVAVLDISDPTAIDYIRWSPETADHVLLADGLIFLSGQYWKTVSIASVSDLNLQAKVHTDLDPGKLAISGTNLFVSAQNSGLAIYDITSPYNLEPLNIYAADEHQIGVSAKYSFSWWINWSGSYSSFGYKIWDLTDPMNPEIRVSGGGGDMGVEPYYSVFGVEGDLVCLSIGDSSGPSAPVICDLSEEPAYTRAFGEYYNSTSLVLTDNIAWFSTDESNLVAVDISDLHNPVTISSTPISYGRFVAEDNSAFIYSRYPNSLTPIDISDPEHPQIGSPFALPTEVQTTRIRGGLAYIGTESSGLLIIDLNDINSPTLLGSFPLSARMRGFEFNGDQALLVHVDGFQVVSIADPEMPVALSPTVGVNDPRGRAVWVGDSIFISEKTGDLEMWDISNPALPALAGSAMGRGHDLYLGDQYLVEPGSIYPMDCLALVPVPDDSEVPIPPVRSLVSAAPNPFNPRTVVSFSLTVDSSVDLSAYDLRGNHLVTLATGFWAAGNHTLQWDGRDKAGRNLSSGTYLLRLNSAEGCSSTKVTLAR